MLVNYYYAILGNILTTERKLHRSALYMIYVSNLLVFPFFFGFLWIAPLHLESLVGLLVFGLFILCSRVSILSLIG